MQEFILRIRQKPVAQLLFLLMMIFSSMLIVNLASTGLGRFIWGSSFREFMSLTPGEYDPSDFRELAMMKYVQIFGHISMTIIPPILFARIIFSNTSDWLKLNRSAKAPVWVLSVVLVFAVVPLISWLTQINGQLQLPAAMEEYQRNMEESSKVNEALITAFLNTRHWGDVLLNLFMMALLPALGEELLFRGGLQQIFTRWLKSPHWAIIITAVLFALMHMNLFNFLAYFTQGVVMGYLFYFTGSLWIPILFHFINNGSIVMLSWYFQQNNIQQDLDTLGAPSHVWQAGLALLFSIIILFFIKRLKSGKLPI